MRIEPAVTSGAGNPVVDAVDAADQGGLAAARGPDEGGDLMGGNIERDLMQRLLAAVGEGDVLDLDRGAHGAGLGDYHLSLRRILARSTIEPKESSATSNRNTSTEPYWARWVYSELGMRAARV